MRLTYNDSLYKLDYNDTASGGIDLCSGWNFIEDAPSLKGVMQYKINVPLYSRFFLSFNGDCFYTSDNQRFSKFYVYDRFLPCRENDPAYASFVNAAGVDIVYELIIRNMYISPSVKWGINNSEAGENNICAAGAKALFTGGGIKAEVSWFYDTDFSVRSGFVMFSVSAVYL